LSLNTSKIVKGVLTANKAGVREIMKAD